MSRPSDTATARPGPRPRYTRTQVLETALRLIDAEDPDTFTMRRVADELGMGVMTLYGYVRNKDEMVEGVTSLAFAEQQREPPTDASWKDRVRSEIEHLYDVSRRHPHLVTLILAQTSASPGLFRLRERMLGLLKDAGFDEPHALRALGVLTSYALGFGGLRASGVIDLPDRIRELPGQEFPHLHTVADSYQQHLSDETFTYGLELLIRGLDADLS